MWHHNKILHNQIISILGDDTTASRITASFEVSADYVTAQIELYFEKIPVKLVVDDHNYLSFYVKFRHCYFSIEENSLDLQPNCPVHFLDDWHVYFLMGAFKYNFTTDYFELTQYKSINTNTYCW